MVEKKNAWLKSKRTFSEISEKNMETFGFELNCDAKDKNNLIGIGECF